MSLQTNKQNSCFVEWALKVSNEITPGTMNSGEIFGEEEGGLCSLHHFWLLNL